MTNTKRKRRWFGFGLVPKRSLVPTRLGLEPARFGFGPQLKTSPSTSHNHNLKPAPVTTQTLRVVEIILGRFSEVYPINPLENLSRTVFSTTLTPTQNQPKLQPQTITSPGLDTNPNPNPNTNPEPAPTLITTKNQPQPIFYL